MASNQMLRAILKPYAMESFVTDSIIQAARTTARKLIFGTPLENVQYTHHVAKQLREQGHYVSIKYTTRKETVKNVERLVVSEELLRLKALNETMTVEERRTFVLNWKKDNKTLLVSQLGSKKESLKFVHGVFFAPSFSTKTVPQLATSTLANTHCFVAMELLPMQTCPLLHLELFLEMRMERAGRNFGSL
jgi:hypothetical protein